MFVLKSTHEAAMAKQAKTARQALLDEMQVNQRALNAERSITASLRAEIESMKPDFLFGQQRRLQNQRAGQKRKAKRAAK